MATDDRLTEIVALVEARGFLSVKELSQTFSVSEVTVRRDLQRLHDEQRLLRTYGGAAPALRVAAQRSVAEPSDAAGGSDEPDRFLMDQVDVLMVVPLNSRSDMILQERGEEYGVPIVAESLAMPGAQTLVAVDNYQAALALGRWAGAYAKREFQARAHVLDLTYHLSNTRERSSGFLAGVQEVLPQATATLSLNTQSDRQSAYRLTSDAIQVHPEINVIFGINDIVTGGAIQACRDLGIAPETMLVLTFGLEGNILKDELMRGEYLKAGLAMFPEIVGPACVEAAIAAFSGVAMPAQIVTPYAVLSTDQMADVYQQRDGNWQFDGRSVDAALSTHFGHCDNVDGSLPKKIGFLVPFIEHEWYINLVAAMRERASGLGIELIVVDAAENLKDELVLRKRGIAEKAAQLVEPGDVILIDGGQVTTYLAEALAGKTGITVITNSMSVTDVLRSESGINLILTGGLLDQESQTLTGPTAESVFRELRADKLFLAVSGVSLDFGLSHTDLAEVAMKQAMIRAARGVVLLADHTKFEQESVVQVAAVDVVDRLITDSALPASTRLDLTKLGIEIILADPRPGLLPARSQSAKCS